MLLGASLTDCIQSSPNVNLTAWGDTNAWSGGDASTHPKGMAISSFQVLDALLAKFSDKSSE